MPLVLKFIFIFRTWTPNPYDALWGFLHVKSTLLKMMKLKTQQKIGQIGLYFLEKIIKYLMKKMVTNRQCKRIYEN